MTNFKENSMRRRIFNIYFDVDSDSGSDTSGSDDRDEDKTGGNHYDRESGTMNHADGSKDRWNNEKGGWDHYDKDGNFTGNDKDPKDGGPTGSDKSSDKPDNKEDRDNHDSDSGSSSGSSGGSSSSSGSGPSSGGSYGGTDLSSGSQTEGAQQASDKAKQDYDKAMNQLGADIGAAQAATEAANKAQQAADKAKQDAAKAQQEAAQKAQAAKEAAQKAEQAKQDAAKQKELTDKIKEQYGMDTTLNEDGSIGVSGKNGLTGNIGPTGGTVSSSKSGITGTTETTSTVDQDGNVKTEVKVNGKTVATAETVGSTTTVTLESGASYDITPEGIKETPGSKPGSLIDKYKATTYGEQITNTALGAMTAQEIAQTEAEMAAAEQAAKEAQEAAEQAAQQAQELANNAAAAQQAANQAAQNAAAAQSALGNSAAAAENAASAMDKAKEAQEAAAGKTSESMASGEKEKEEAFEKELDKILGGEETPPDGETPPEDSPDSNHQSATDKINDNANKVTNQMQDVLITGSFNDFISQLITVDWLSGPDKESVLNQMDELAQYDNRTHEKVMDTIKDFVSNIKQISASPTLTYFQRIKEYIAEIGAFFKECMSALKDSQFARALTLGFSLLRIAFTVMTMVALPQAAIPILGGFLVRWGWHAIKQGIKSDWKPEELGFRDGYDNAHQQWAKDFTIMGDEVFGDSDDPLSELHPNKYNVQQSHNYAGYNNGLKAAYSDEDVKSYIIKVTRKSPIIRKWSK